MFCRTSLRVVLLILAASFLVTAIDQVSAQALEATLLFGFEDSAISESVTANAADMKLVTGAGVTSGRQALKVEFPASVQYAGVTLEPETAWDWSDLSESGVMLDIANPGSHSVHLYVEVEDVHGSKKVQNASVPANGEPNTYYVVLNSPVLTVDSGLRDDPTAWQLDGQKLISSNSGQRLDLSRIARIKLYTSTILHDRTLIVDNVRLFENAKRNPEFLVRVCDRFGQNTNADYPTKVHSEEELRARADEELMALANVKPMPDRSKFGGWKNGPRLKATGYFRTEKIGGKWALVDPEGCLFFSTGLANARMANTATMTGIDFREPTVRQFDPEEVTPEDSKPFVKTDAAARQTRFIASDLRHKLFEWLPSYDNPLSDHYTYVRSVHKGPVEHGEAYSFYQANLERRYGESSPGSYLTKWRDVTVDRMVDWGFTSLGNWTDPSFYHVDRVPYFANGWIIGNFKTISTGKDYWSPMPDPFDPEFVRRARVTTKAIAAEVKNNPWCVGVFVDNEKSWGRMGSIDSQYRIVLTALGMNATQSPTKAAFTQLLRSQYGTIDRLNSAWKLNLSSWQEFENGIELKARNQIVKDDLSRLLSLYACEYFRVVDEALNSDLPNHMYLGVRMARWGLTTEVVSAAKKYTDVISYNYYTEGIRDENWDILHEVDMPSIIGEFHMGETSGSGMFNPGLIAAADQADRARMFKEYMESVIDNPYFVGAHWFQYTDSPLTGRSYDGENYNVGFVAVTDIPYPEMVAAAKELNESLYDRRFANIAHPTAPNEAASTQGAIKK